jgi:Icc-related predicted phosphoesterase
MLVGAVADIHGNFGALRDAMTAHADVPFWICVGDVASRSGEYPVPAAPLYWIKGNNEAFDRIAEWQSGCKPVTNLHYIPNGTATRVGSLTVAGLGGTYAPTWYDTPADQLPHTPRDDKRRHFVREEVERCKQLVGVDILMTHEAPRPFIVSDEGPSGTPRRHEAGKRPINEVLAALKPRLHLCGHHHRFVETEREGVTSVCLDRISRSYLLIDAGTLACRKVEQ